LLSRMLWHNLILSWLSMALLQWQSEPILLTMRILPWSRTLV
jgi:hypothetical protein